MKKKPWGGRFKKGTDEKVEAFTSSLSVDLRLAKYDIIGSIAHAKTLANAGVIDEGELDVLVGELEKIGHEIADGKFAFDSSLEDIHMNIEAALRERLGDLGGRIHTARSRNDQVATDTCLFVKEEAGLAVSALSKLRGVILDLAKKHIDVVMPGYTHLQRAQPVLLSHHLLAYWEMFYRDAKRFEAAGKSADVMPLGSGALAGVPYPLDRQYTAKLLGFSDITRNSMDAVSNRDFVLDYIYAAAVCMMHLSRLASELVIFSSSEFGFVILPDDYATGSSIMPHKKNPDVPELIRGKTGRVYGDLLGILAMMKGLPLAYMRDMQEDKEALFDARDTARASISVMSGLLSKIEFDAKKMASYTLGNFITATDASDYLVKKGMNFRDAHEVVGKMVADLEAKGKNLFNLSYEEWKGFCPVFEKDIIEAITCEASISSRKTFGGTSKVRVEGMIDFLSELEIKELEENS
jgi:argininosuccinate lyase